MTKSKPVICTLTTVELHKRSAAWKDLVRRAGSRTAVTPDGIAIAFADLTNPQELEELVALERTCCEWMTLDLTREDAGWVLRMSADSDEGVAVVRNILTST